MNYDISLKEIIKASGITQEELANRLDVSFATLNSWINNKSQPRKKAIDKINAMHANVLGTDAIDAAMLADYKAVITKKKLSVDDLSKDKTILDVLSLHLTYNTNTIEGSTMTLADTEAVMFEHKILNNRTQSEHIEVKNHQAALYWLIEYLSKNDSLNRDFILQLHLRLMNGLIGDAGAFRSHSVRIMGSRVATANYLKVPLLIDKFIDATNKDTSDIVKHLAYTHAMFEKIHPFSDGNGRIGRLLMLALALRHNTVPPIIARERKYAYYKYLELAQSKDVYEPMELFIAESILSSDSKINSMIIVTKKPPQFTV